MFNVEVLNEHPVFHAMKFERTVVLMSTLARSYRLKCSEHRHPAAIVMSQTYLQMTPPLLKRTSKLKDIKSKNQRTVSVPGVRAKINDSLWPFL